MRRKLIALVTTGLSSVTMAQNAPAPQRVENANVRPAAGAPAQPANLDRASRQPTAPRPQGAENAKAALPRTGGSLLQVSLAAQADPAVAKASDLSFYSVPAPEPKVIKKHDLVTIIVREENTFSSEGTNEVKKEADLNAVISEFVKLKIRNLELEGGGIGPVAPSVRMSGSRNFKGEGTVDRKDRFITRITAEVLDVKPNGTLVLQARGRIKIDDEQQEFVLAGICRAEDITADNSVLSTQMFDLDLQKRSKGDVRNATRRGWGGKLLDAVSPF